MKRAIYCFILCFCFQHISAQPAIDTTHNDTARLVQQKENIITSATIIKVENMGSLINTHLSELRPTISADGNLLFFIRENHPHNTNYNAVRNSQDIWFTMRDTSGTWSKAVHLGYPLNTALYNSVFWISPDNNRILIRGAFINGDYAGTGISMCWLQEDGYWSKPEALIIRNYVKYDRGQRSGATMGHDGKTLLLYMSPDKGSPLNDIYVSFLLPDRTWSEPKSLGKKINLPNNDEMTPYLASDGETLYFSSDRPGGR